MSTLRSKLAAAVHHKGEPKSMADNKAEGEKLPKEKEKGFSRLEVDVPPEMGCTPSQAVIIHPPADRNVNLQPTIFMVAQENFQMLRELGELKFYHLAQYDAEETERVHHEFASRLENPVQYEKQQKHQGFTSTRENEETVNEKTVHLSKDNAENSNNLCSITEVSSCMDTAGSLGDSRATNAGFKELKQVTVQSPKKCPEEVTTSAAKTTSIHTLEATTKSKTFFRRNRVQPTAQQRNEYSVQQDVERQQQGLPISEQIELTEVTQVTSQLFPKREDHVKTTFEQ